MVLKSRYSRVFEECLESYYRFSPSIAEAMMQNKVLKYAIKYTVVWPFVILARAFALVFKERGRNQRNGPKQQ